MACDLVLSLNLLAKGTYNVRETALLMESYPRQTVSAYTASTEIVSSGIIPMTATPTQNFSSATGGKLTAHVTRRECRGNSCSSNTRGTNFTTILTKTSMTTATRSDRRKLSEADIACRRVVAPLMGDEAV